jgi:hypothetical protein
MTRPESNTRSDHADVVDRVVAHVRSTLPPPWAVWPGGWPDQIDAALLDAVLSIRAKYGQPHNGVRGAVRRWQDTREHADDLTVLADCTPSDLAGVIGHQKLSGGKLKSQAIIEAATRLIDAGVRHAVDLDPKFKTHRHAYVGVHGLGAVTWEYFLMLLGRPGVKADRWIIRFVDEAIPECAHTSETARNLIVAAADRLGVSPTALDHAIWSLMRARRR